jgi:hypothetical protein
MHSPTYKQQHLEKHKNSHAPAEQENNNIKTKLDVSIAI